MNYTNINNSSVSYTYDQLKNMTIIVFMIRNKHIEFGVSEDLYIPYITYRFWEVKLEEVERIVNHELEFNDLDIEENLIPDDLPEREEEY